MKAYYMAVTYDVCKHNDLCEEVNRYVISLSVNEMDRQVNEFAKLDVAPLIRVYKSLTDDFKQITLYKEYYFKEYECNCER